MKTYHISEEGVERLRNRAIKRMSVIFIIIVCTAIAFNVYNLADEISWPVVLFSSIFVGGALAYGFRRGINQNIEIWKSIQINVGEDFISRSQVRISEVTIRQSEIVGIDEISGGLCIRTADKMRSLAIPEDLDSDDFQEIRDHLATWAEIEPQAENTQAKNILLGVFLLVGFGAVFLSSSLWVVLIAGTILSGYYVYFCWTLYQSDGVDPKFRRNMLFSSSLPFLLTIFRVIALSGFLS